MEKLATEFGLNKLLKSNELRQPPLHQGQIRLGFELHR